MGKTDGGGWDTIYLSVYGEWNPEDWVQLRTVLEDAKRRAQAEKRPMATHDGLDVMPLVVEPTGCGGGVLETPWRATAHGMMFRFYDRVATVVSGDQKRPVLHVEIGSIPLMAGGGEACVRTALELLSDLGLRIDLMSPSRADLCVDLPGLDMEWVRSAIAEQRIITRAKTVRGEDSNAGERRSWQGRAVDDWRTESVMFGQRGRPVVLRIYDKVAELLAKGDEVKQELLRERWGGHSDQAVRVEFEVRRDWFRKRKINSVGELFDGARSISQYMTTEWFRITDDKPDRSNSTRYGAGEVWRRVQDAFESWTTGGDAPLGRAAECVSLDWERNAKIGVAYLEGALARRLLSVPDTAAEFVEGLECIARDSIDGYAELGRAFLDKFLGLFERVQDDWDSGSRERMWGRVMSLRAALPKGSPMPKG